MTLRGWLGLSLLWLGTAAAVSSCGQINGDAVSNTSQTLNYLYVSNNGSSTISAFQFQAGSLNAAYNVMPTGVGTNGACGMLASPNGEFVYVTESETGNVSQFSVAGTSASYPGELLSITGINPVTAGNGANQIIADPTFTYAYVSDSSLSTGNISEFTINSTTGALTTNTTSATADASIGPTGMAIAPSGPYLYVVNNGTSNISGFSISSFNGSLTALTGSPFSLGGQLGAKAIITHPNGKFIYVANETSGTVSGFSVGTTGTLSALSPATTTVGTTPFALAFNPAGTLLFVANQGSSTVSVFSVNASTGALTAVSGSPFTTSPSTNPSALAVDPTGTYLAVTTTNANAISGGAVTIYTIASSGALTVDVPATTVGQTPEGVIWVSVNQSL